MGLAQVVWVQLIIFLEDIAILVIILAQLVIAQAIAIHAFQVIPLMEAFVIMNQVVQQVASIVAQDIAINVVQDIVYPVMELVLQVDQTSFGFGLSYLLDSGFAWSSSLLKLEEEDSKVETEIHTSDKRILLMQMELSSKLEHQFINNQFNPFINNNNLKCSFNSHKSIDHQVKCNNHNNTNNNHKISMLLSQLHKLKFINHLSCNNNNKLNKWCLRHQLQSNKTIMEESNY